LRERREVLKSMFGESIGEEVMDELEQEYGEAIRTGKHAFGVTGGIAMSPAIAKAKPAVKPSTFYGSKCPRR
jgi:chorismate synthase